MNLAVEDSAIKIQNIIREKMNNIIGENVSISDKARAVKSVLKDYSRLKDYAELIECTLGEYSYLSQFSMAFKTNIGKFCSIAHGSYIGLWEHNTYVTTHSFYLYETSGGFVKGYRNYDKDSLLTTIENDVWIGANAVILKGIKVSNGAIIGAGSVVTKDVPPYAIAVGNPAKVLKYRFSQDEIEFLLEKKWWDMPREALQEMVNERVFFSFDDLKKFLNKK